MKLVLSPNFLKSVDVCAFRDLGGMAYGTRMGTFFLPFNIFTEFFATSVLFVPYYKKDREEIDEVFTECNATFSINQVTES